MKYEITLVRVCVCTYVSVWYVCVNKKLNSYI